MIDRLEEVVGSVVKDALEEERAPDDRQSKRRRPLPDIVVEPGQRHFGIVSNFHTYSSTKFVNVKDVSLELSVDCLC